MRVGLLLLCLGCAMVSVSTPARAQTNERPLSERVSLSTVDPCMTAEPLVGRIAHWLHHDQIDGRILVRVLDRQTQLSFEIVFQERVVAERTFTVLPRDCAARRDAFALAVSLAVDNVVQRREEIAAEIAAETPNATHAADNAANPDVAPTEPVVTAQEPTVDDAEADSARVSPDGAEDGETREGGLQLGLALGAGALAHGLPGWAVVGEAAVELSGRWFMARLGALASTPGTVVFQGGEVASRLLGGRADLCVTDAIGAFGLHGCLGAQTGVVHMVGRDFMRSTTTVQPWAAGAVRIALEWPHDTLRARVFAEGMIPLLSPAARVVDSEGVALGQLTTVRVGVILGVQALVVFH